jgi:TolB protein
LAANDVERNLRAGITAVRQGDRVRGRRLLSQVIRADPDNELAWMWMASAVNTNRERRACLERALEINPSNTRAREALAALPAASAADAAPTSAGSGGGGLNVGGILLALLFGSAILVALVVGPDLFEAVVERFEPTPTAVVIAPTSTASPIPPTRTPNLFDGTSLAPTLPPTFTPTRQPTPTETPRPSPTPFPVEAFEVLYTSLAQGEAEPALYRISGDGGDAVEIGQGFRDVTFSPSGDQIAFVRSVTGEDGESFPELFVADVDDLDNAQQLTEMSTSIVAHPSWAPNGEELVFISDFNGTEDIWYITVNGDNLRRITEDDEASDREPAWSPVPNSRQVVFTSNRTDVVTTEIYALEVVSPGRELPIEQLTNSSNSSYAPSWSHDGEQIVFISDRGGDPDVYIMSAEGTNATRLTSNDNDAEDRAPVFTPDDRFVAFISNRQDDRFQSYLLSVDGDVLVRLTDSERDDQRIVYRPELRLRLR